MAVPSKMVAGEKKAAIEQQDAVSRRVARRWNRSEGWSEFNRLAAVENDFGIGLSSQLGSVDRSSAAESSGVPIGPPRDSPRSHDILRPTAGQVTPVTAVTAWPNGPTLRLAATRANVGETGGKRWLHYPAVAGSHPVPPTF